LIGLLGLAALMLDPWASSLISVAHRNAPGANSATFLQNPAMLVRSLWLYATPPLVILGAVGMARLRNDKAVQLLVAWLVGGNAMLLVLPLSPFYPRWALAGTIPLILLATSGLTALRARFVVRWPRRSWAIAVMLIGTVCVFSWPQDAATIADPANGTYLPIDQAQYVSGWPSGYGLAHAADYVRRLATTRTVTLVTSPTSLAGARLHDMLAADSRVSWCVTDLRVSPAQVARTCTGRPALLVAAWPDVWTDGPSHIPATAVFTVTQEDGSRIALFALPSTE
jgi:4-amino-4-deoxy-L-arabinose transferase-like glycosyltransferase